VYTVKEKGGKPAQKPQRNFKFMNSASGKRGEKKQAQTDLRWFDAWSVKFATWIQLFFCGI
jgi:hypothetical protein